MKAPPIVGEVLRSSGQPLDQATRAFFEPRFGHDFSQVRVHTDARAAESARAVNAVAYTVGEHMVFDIGHYAPSTGQGRNVLAHELTHVLQQGGGVEGPSIQLGQVGDAYERQADQAASALAGGNAASELIGRTATSGLALLQRLGPNPNCTKAEADGIHQAIYDARGWLNKAIPQMEASPLSAKVLASLRRNFGPTYGVAANAPLIAGRLKVALGALARISIACDTAGATDSCKKDRCGWTAGAGSSTSTICTNPPSTLSLKWPQAPGCVLHESFHASMSFMTVDRYKNEAGYPGVLKEPLLNADSYTFLAEDLS
jgi:hypothetical protein